MKKQTLSYFQGFLAVILIFALLGIATFVSAGSFSKPNYLKVSGSTLIPIIDIWRYDVSYLSTGTDAYVVTMSGGIATWAADTDTTYTATSTLLELVGTEFGVTHGTLTNARFCTYDTTDGIVCNSEAGVTLTKEQVQDYAWDITGGAQTLITVTYQDGTNDVDFIVNDDLNLYDNSTSSFLTSYTETDPIWNAASSSFLTTASAAINYISTSSALINYISTTTLITNYVSTSTLANNYYTTSSISTNYLATGTAASTYLTMSSSTATYFTIAGADASNTSWLAKLTEEEVEDYVGTMFGGTETLISVAYNDGDNDIDFVVVADLSQFDNTTSSFATTGQLHTAVTLETSSHDYLSLSTQEITLGIIDFSDDTNATSGAGITFTGDTISATLGTSIDISDETNLSTSTAGISVIGDNVGLVLGAIDHDSLLNFVAAEHIDWISTTTAFETDIAGLKATSSVFEGWGDHGAAGYLVDGADIIGDTQIDYASTTLSDFTNDGDYATTGSPITGFAGMLGYDHGGTNTTTALALQYLWWGDGTGNLVQVASNTLAGAGAGDVESVGDCSSGACFDGSSDGGTNIEFYNIDSNKTQLIASDVASNLVITLPVASMTIKDWEINSGTIHTDNYIENPFGADVGVAELASADFGSWTCDGSNCFLDADSVTSSQIAVDAVQDAEIDYSAVTLADFTDDISNATTGSTVALANALAANGANATSGWGIIGVDASGVYEGAFDAWTEAENTAASYIDATALANYMQDEDINTFSELQAWVTDEILLASSSIDTSAELLAILGDETGTGVLVFDTSPTFTTGITVPADSISDDELDEGATFTWTGTTHSFAGVTNLLIPGVADADGEIAIDKTNDDQFVYYGDVENVLSGFIERCFTLENASDTDDNVPIWSPHRAIAITDVYCRTQGGTSVVITISDGTNALEAITCDANGQADDGSIANGAFIANERMEFDTGTVTGEVDWTNVCITYNITAD